MSSITSINSKMSSKSKAAVQDSWEDSWEDEVPVKETSGKKIKKISKTTVRNEEDEEDQFQQASASSVQNVKEVEEDWNTPQEVVAPEPEKPESEVIVKKSRFEDMGLSDPILRALFNAKENYEKPKVHQKTAIPTAIKCYNDAVAQNKTPPHMLVCAPTGSGKTLSYVLSTLNTIDPATRKTQVMIVCNTRELAGEIYERVCGLVAANAELPKDILGVERKRASDKNDIFSVALHRGTHSDANGSERNHAQKYFTSATNFQDLGNEQIVIGTVRRSLDLIQNNVYVGTEHRDMFVERAKKNKVKVPRGQSSNNLCMINIDTTFIQEFVMDEADDLMNTGSSGHMAEYVYEILDSLPSYTRYIMYSATMSQNIRLFGDEVNAMYLEFKATEKTNAIINHTHVNVNDDESKVNSIIEIIKRMPDIGSIIIFTSAIKALRTIASDLEQAEFAVVCIHSHMTQTNRDQAISNFKEGNVRIIVATDVIGRGVDIPLVDLVINFDLPEDDYRIYQHRSGRAGRAGKIGQCISLVTTNNNAIPLVITKIAKSMSITISALTNDMLLPVK